MTAVLASSRGVLSQVAAVGGGTFPSLGSLWARYKASDETGSVGDAKAPQDISGVARHMIQATSSKRPTLQNGPNGKRVYRWDGTDDECAIPNLSAVTGLTGFMVFKLVNDPPLSTTKTGWWRLGSSGTGIHGPYTDGSIYDDAGFTVRQTVGNPTLSMSSTFRRYCVTATGAGVFTVYLDNSQIFTASSLTFGCSATPKFGGTPDFPDMDLAELVLCSDALSTSDRNALDAYSVSEYGL